MDEVRIGSVQNDSLRQNFLAKLLSGDGSLDSRKTSKRLDVRIKIVDQNTEYLHDYAEILAMEGFKAKVLKRKLTVRAYCTWMNLLKLYQIGAFRNNRNWIKLLCSIKIAIRGREIQGYRRIQELSKLERITNHDVCFRYGIGTRSANLWIGHMRRLNLMKRLPRVPGDPYNGYTVTSLGKIASSLLDAMELDYLEICAKRGIDDPEIMLSETKQKNLARGSSTEQRSQTG
jgi:intein/homing endonuclease